MANQTLESTPNEKLGTRHYLRRLWQYVTLIGTATLIIGAFELFFLLTSSQTHNTIQIPLLHFVAGNFMSSFILMTIHILPALLLGYILKRTVPLRFYPQQIYGLVIAALFGLGWQNTLLDGDGIRAHAHFDSIRFALRIVVPAVMIFFTWFCLWNERIQVQTRKNIMLLVFAASLLFNLNVLLNYREFHGFLAIFNATTLMGFSGH